MDKGNAKLNSWCEREGTMEPSRWDTFGENFNFTVSFLSCLIFSLHRCAPWKAWKPFLYYFFFSFSFYYVGYIHFFKKVPLNVLETGPRSLVLFPTTSCHWQCLHPILSCLFHFLSSSSLLFLHFLLPLINCYVRVSCDFHKTSFPLFKKYVSNLNF